MIQIDLIKTWERIKVWFPYVLSLVFAILLFFKYNSTSGLESENKGLKNEVLRSEILSKGYLNLVSEKNKIIASHEKKIDSLKNEIVVSKSKTIEIKKESEKKIKEVYLLTTKQIVDSWKSRYSPKEDIQYVGKDVAVTDTVAKQIESDLVKKDYLSLELNQTKKTLSLTESASAEKDTVISDLKDQKKNLFMVVEEDKKTKESQKQIIKNTEKELSSEKNKKTFWKATAIGVGTVIIVKSILKK